jgi:hypothetical protein
MGAAIMAIEHVLAPEAIDRDLQAASPPEAQVPA